MSKLKPAAETLLMVNVNVFDGAEAKFTQVGDIVTPAPRFTKVFVVGQVISDLTVILILFVSGWPGPGVVA